MRFLTDLLTGDTLTQVGNTMTDQKGNVWNRINDTWYDSHGNFIKPLQDNLSMNQRGSLFQSWGDNNDF